MSIVNGRRDGVFICSRETPWHPDRGTPVQHMNAREIGEQCNGYPGGDLVTMRCPWCGTEWEEELAQ